MKTKTLKLIALTLALILALPAGSVFAGTATANLPVSATVSANCTINLNTALAFTPAYDPIVANAAAALPGTGSLDIVCTNGSSVVITLDQGLTPAGGSTNAAPLRQMASGANRLPYGLFTDPGMTTTWDNVVGQTVIGSGVTQTINVYGQIPAAQNVPAGGYNDTVVATITF